ncbi:MAG: NAD(P)/FAD-dependent oxidoreductase [Planctomycetia bacterium]|nr:NAD(P)/FAD-dependent oxidoreductase [Planctomycetia bacterium]
MQSQYDIIVIGSGLGGMTAANILARAGHKTLLCEFHHQLGGLAAWFRRKNGVIFDVSLHGFPVGMIKSCRRYWNREIADSIVQLPSIRFDNPMFSLETTFNREDFTRLLIEKFGIPAERVHAFFDKARSMTFVDDQGMTTRQLFEEFFPGREDVARLLMEPITYANGSTLDEPAITYGIVFSNFMSKGVFTFVGGTDKLIDMMKKEMLKNGVDIATNARVEKIEVEDHAVAGVVVNGQFVRAKSIVSNSNLKSTIFDMVGREHFDADFIDRAEKVRLNNSSAQVYMSLKPGEILDESRCGDLLFTSTAPKFDTKMLLSRQITSRTYSFYYPKTRPGVSERCAIVSSTNANYDDWAKLSREEYEVSKKNLIEDTLDAVEKYVPGIRQKIDWVEAATPCTFERYTLHKMGASFGTKFEGLEVSRSLPNQVAGLYHTGSVGIIMSGWLGAVNYGVIVANDADAFVRKSVSREK